jgi:hypothetical protein
VNLNLDQLETLAVIFGVVYWVAAIVIAQSKARTRR